jgi:hypothetical protein
MQPTRLAPMSGGLAVKTKNALRFCPQGLALTALGAQPPLKKSAYVESEAKTFARPRPVERAAAGAAA